MKKFIFLIVLLLLPVMVNAEELNTLIPIDTKASVKTEKFEYNNIIYNSALDDKGNSLISFDSIKNNMLTPQPVSINVLLFGSDKKNIGLVSYCSDRDLDSNYSGFKLASNEAKPFSIKVSSKYFIDTKTASDVKYIAIMDENKYCHIGGYTNYKNKTIDEIVNGTSTDKLNPIQKAIVYLQENNLFPIVIVVAVGLIVFVILMMIIKAVIKKAKDKPVKYKPHDDAPIEETVDLSYDNMTLDDDNSNNDGFDVSIGGNTNQETPNTEVKEDKKEEKEEESDLTKFFN